MFFKFGLIQVLVKIKAGRKKQKPKATYLKKT